MAARRPCQLPYFTLPDPCGDEDLSYDVDRVGDDDIDLETELVITLPFADLTGADLAELNLIGADLRHADLRYVNLERTLLNSADLSHSDLREANLVDAELRGANFTDADLSHAQLAGAKLGWTVFAQTTLRGTKGLEKCEHHAPSTIGIDTFFRWREELSEDFLRGCGVPVQLIKFTGTPAGQGTAFYSCFISYSSQDQSFAERLYADLRAKNLRCWFAPEDLKIGDRFQERIEESIRLFDKVMIVLSENSMKSRWVEREVNAAREREDRENRTVLFPIRIDDAVMNAPQPWAADIRRSRHIGDFSRWKDHDLYTMGFERLLRDLEATGSASSHEA